MITKTVMRSEMEFPYSEFLNIIGLQWHFRVLLHVSGIFCMDFSPAQACDKPGIEPKCFPLKRSIRSGYLLSLCSVLPTLLSVPTKLITHQFRFLADFSAIWVRVKVMFSVENTLPNMSEELEGNLMAVWM